VTQIENKVGSRVGCRCDGLCAAPQSWEIVELAPIDIPQSNLAIVVCVPCPTCGHENPPHIPDGSCEVCDAYWQLRGYDTYDEYVSDLRLPRRILRSGRAAAEASAVA
jgi:hypothetical protein